ncbi:MAG: pyruvate dehydrogenase [SAR202 cluster bacterium]|nr:pyruvate dehydrogenase [SAR202 cluster bacterium]
MTLEDPRESRIDYKNLLDIQDKVLWISMKMIDYANNHRENLDGIKIGGHQASSASVVTILTSLFFDFLKAEDKISIKPHASPVLHAIHYLLGNLDKKYLNKLRAFHGLQAYPSRTKDPDRVDFSTGSVGLGAIGPNFAALVNEYVHDHFDGGNNGRFVSVLGDAELDEGVVWEAIAEPSMTDLKNVLWVVDLNRQSLDRVVPGIRMSAWRKMFEANNWKVIEAKYGKELQRVFAQEKGELLKNAIDDMPNEVYQRLLRVPADILREWIPKTSKFPKDLEKFIGQWNDKELQSLIRNLGGHDFEMLREAFTESDSIEGPRVVFAYTLKGWNLPIVGDPQNHSAMLNSNQMEELRENLNVDIGDDWPNISEDSEEYNYCKEIGESYKRVEEQKSNLNSFEIPKEFKHVYRGNMSTQQSFGLVLTDISRIGNEISDRVVTVSPDVASSTNLGGWINKVNVWARGDRGIMPQEIEKRALDWQESPKGKHIELGISENNLFMMLGQLGLSYEIENQILFPIGTVYDPFVRRGLDAFFQGIYSGAKFIVVGTPSGVSLSPEGGAHQSIITPSIGIELPEVDFYEPCFAQELEWIILNSMEKILARDKSTYLRLSTRRIDQSLFSIPDDFESREVLRKQIISGAYLIIDRRDDIKYDVNLNVVNIFASGVMVPEAIKASNKLIEEGLFANVINVTGAGPLYRSFQASTNAIFEGGNSNLFINNILSSDDTKAPIVSIVDGHSHSLAWLGGALKTSIIPLGVSNFGQSGLPSELYKENNIDSDSIIEACFTALDN